MLEVMGMVEYQSKSSDEIMARQAKARVYAMSPEQAHFYLMDLATKLEIDLNQADLEETRRNLSKGTPLSRIVLEMREE